MESERTCWAEGMGLTTDEVEALTLVSEEARRRGLDLDLDPRDVDGWAASLSAAGADDLADMVREVRS